MAHEVNAFWASHIVSSLDTSIFYFLHMLVIIPFLDAPLVRRIRKQAYTPHIDAIGN